MKMNNADMPAMPSTTWDNEFDKVTEQSDGLTKREHFAAMAMQGLISNGAMIDGVSDSQIDWAAKSSLKIADALLAELEK